MCVLWFTFMLSSSLGMLCKRKYFKEKWKYFGQEIVTTTFRSKRGFTMSNWRRSMMLRGGVTGVATANTEFHKNWSDFQIVWLSIWRYRRICIHWRLYRLTIKARQLIIILGLNYLVNESDGAIDMHYAYLFALQGGVTAHAQACAILGRKFADLREAEGTLCVSHSSKRRRQPRKEGQSLKQSKRERKQGRTHAL